ncbi:MAG TPA: hypothetical protein VFJ62_13145, partial [Usitatibacter sp.]|nr:hypothetical protein [Usitatibacter sp.]
FAAGPWLRDRIGHARATLRAVVFFVAAAMAYAVGAMRAADSRENLLFTAGALLLALAIAASISATIPRLRRFGALRGALENARGAPFFATALIALPVAGAAYILGRSLAAEQLALVVYWSLVVGVAVEAWARRRGGADRAAADNGPR